MLWILVLFLLKYKCSVHTQCVDGSITYSECTNSSASNTKIEITLLKKSITEIKLK